MPARSSRSLLAGASAGLLIVATATAAHLAAGGAIDIYALIGIAAMSVALSTTLASRVRLTFLRAVTVTLLLQPVMHQMLGHGAGVASDATGHSQHDMTMPGQGTHWASAMLATHAAVALACAVILLWGVRWLRTMPAIGRALVVWTRGVAVPVTLSGATAAAGHHTVERPLAILFAWDNRGPPH